MEIQAQTQEEILNAISKIGTTGATITQIAKRVEFERHTLSKYLSFMQANGLIYYNSIGKAKVWFINKAPLKTVLHALPEKKTFTERILSDFISAIPCGVLILDIDYNIQFINSKVVSAYGEVEGKKFYPSIVDDENTSGLKKINEVISGKIDFAKIYAFDKNKKYIKLRISRFINPDNSVSALVILEDITEVKKSQDQIYEQKILLEAEREALNNAAIVAETDVSGSITYVNDKFIEISGYSRKELIGKTHKIINSGHHPKSFFKNLWSTISHGKVWTGIIRNRAKDGHFYWVDSAIAPVLGKNGKPVKYIAIRFDITKYMKRYTKKP